MLVVSLLIATCGLSTVLIINASAKQSFANNNTFLISNVQYQVIPKTTQAVLSKQDYVHLRKLGFHQIIALAQASTHVYLGQQRVSKRQIDITGIDTIALLPIQSLGKSKNVFSAARKDEANLLTSMPFTSPVGIVHPSLLRQLINNTKSSSSETNSLNFSIRVNGNNLNSTQALSTVPLPKLITFTDPSLGNDIVTDISEFYRLFPNSNLTSLLLVSALQGPELEELLGRIKLALPQHLRLVTLNDGVQQGDLTNSFHINLLAMALLMFVVCLFIVINAVNLLINARMPWFTICRQLGLSRQVIFMGQIIEALMITLFASCLGIYLSIHLSNLVAPTVQATLEGLYGVEVGFGNTSLLSLFLQVFGISVCGAIGATFAPFSQSKQLLNSARTIIGAEVNKKKWHRNFWFLCIFFSCVSFALLLVASALWLLLVGTASLLLAGCCLLLANYPRVIDVVYRIIPNSFVMLRISTKQSAALSGKTKVACCAFFIAATSNIGMNLMVDSFRGATISWLDSKLASDYYLYYEGNLNIVALGEKANVEVFQRFENEIQYKGSIIQQSSLPVNEQFKKSLVFYRVNNIESAWDAFINDNGIIINQQFAFEHGLGINESIWIPHPSTRKITEYLVQGIVYDFGNPYKQVLLPQIQFDATISKSAIYSINADSTGLQAFKIVLNDQGIDSERFLLNTKQLMALSKDAFDRTFIITDGLNIVTLLVAALSLACAIVVLMNDVRPQNMLIRSLGVSTVKTQLLALFQYTMLCVIALVFATPFGILLSWVLIFEINLQAFQWTYPLHINPLRIIQIYALSIGIVLLVIALPIINAGKRPLIEDIRCLN